MRQGSLVADRFRVERAVARGGSGTVYRAVDETTGEPIALKVAVLTTQEEVTRWGREAQLLAELRHPGIVRYIAHGSIEGGTRFLAMEWVDGEDLSVRLAFDKLRVDHAILLLYRIAEALAVAHKKGVVHRDIKPSNLLLCEGDLTRVKIVDFGLARRGGAVRTITRSGIAIGTPGYMAPEQARGLASVDRRADVFSMGCVLYQCLTGLPPFFGDHPTAVLAKIVIEDAPRVRELNDDVPETLDDLVARMLAKDPDARPPDAAQVAEELAAIGSLDGKRRAALRVGGLTSTEQRLSSVVLATGLDPINGDAAVPISDADLERLGTAAASFGARLDRLADGSVVVSFASRGTPTERAINAARCALALRDVAPKLAFALATGWNEAPAGPVSSPRGFAAVGNGSTGAPTPLGELIDHAARLVAERRKRSSPSSRRRAFAEPIAVDEITAGLLRTRFDVEPVAGGFAVWGERDPIEVPTTVRGKPTECVGRETEIARLLGLFDVSIAAPGPRAVLLTGVAGIGKSRLCQELVRRLRLTRRRHQVWTARGDPLAAAAPFGLLARALRREAGLLDGEPIEQQRRKLRSRMEQRLSEVGTNPFALPAAEVSRVIASLGEIVGAPSPDGEREALGLPRRDSLQLDDQLLRAWEDLLLAECAAEPVVLVLEDAQWGDAHSLRFIDATLRNLRGSPLFVLATGRPEIDDVHPSLWAQRGAERITIRELAPEASEELVRQALTDPPAPNVLARIVERARGHAFYLEELVRAVADGRGDALPESVLAMVHARLEHLGANARRVLRAASIFGQTFYKRGIAPLLGPMPDLDAVLRELEDSELIVRRDPGRFPEEEEFVFFSDVVRDAAYALVTDSDRMLGHRGAGEWLERAGETNAFVLGDHFERGADPQRALPYQLRRAEQALARNDLATVLAVAAKALQSGAVGEQLGALRQLEAEAHFWRGDLADAERSGLEAMRLLPRGSDPWCRAAADVTVATTKLGNVDRMLALVEALRAQDRKRAASGKPSASLQIALARAAPQLLFAGRYQDGDAVIARARDSAAARARDPGVLGAIEAASALRALVAGDLASYGARLETAIDLLEQAGEARFASAVRTRVGHAQLQYGAYARADALLADAASALESMGFACFAAEVKHQRSAALAALRRHAEAVALERAAIDAFRMHGDRPFEGAARAHLARLLSTTDQLDEAEREARAAIDLLATCPPIRTVAFASLAFVLLERATSEPTARETSNVVGEALERARAAADLLGTLGGTLEGEAFILLVHAEAIRATGDERGARDAIAEARQHLLRRANKIPDEAMRFVFLTAVPENARTLALATAWLADA